MESFGLGYDVLAEINPRLIYCSVSAFGRTGPRKDSPGYEALMQAFSGIMSITGEPGGQPVRAGVSFLDLTTGVLCALGISNAIIQRQRTGLGQRVDGSLLETAVALLNYHAEGYLLTGAVPRALGSSHPSVVPYRNFRCRDEQWVFIAGANDRLWRRLAAALGLGDMAEDPRFATNIERVKHRTELEQRVGDAIAGHDREALLRGASVYAYPSIYEGFGLPPLEAMSADVPVVTTAAGSLPEVAGPGADLVPVGDAEALAVSLARVLTDDEHRRDLQGRRQPHREPGRNDA